MENQELVSAIKVAKLLLSYDQRREYFNDNKMTSTTDEEINLETEKEKFISKIFRYFKNYHDKDLETFSHDDIAWKERFNGRQGEDEDKMIINEEVKNFYRDILGHIVREVELS